MSVTAVPLRPVRRGIMVLLWLGIIGAAAIAVALAYAGSPIHTTASGLRYEVLKPGDGQAHPTDSDMTLVRYKGTLLDGKVFDDETQRAVPMPVSGVVPGFSEGLKLMSKGAKYRFWMKPDLAYGDKSPDPSVIPNGATLVFDVDLVDFIDQQTLRQLQMQQMMQQQGGGMGGPPGAAGPQGGSSAGN